MQEVWYIALSIALVVSFPVGLGLTLYGYYFMFVSMAQASLVGALIPTLIFCAWWNTEIRWARRMEAIRKTLKGSK